MTVHFPSVNFLWSNSCSTAEHSSPQTFSTPQKASNQFVKTQPAGLYPFPFISRSRMQSRNVHFDLFSSGADAGNGDILWKTEQLLSGMKLSMRSCERGVQKDGKQVAKKAALTEILSQNLAACFLASCCSANCRATAQSPRSVSPRHWWSCSTLWSPSTIQDLSALPELKSNMWLFQASNPNTQLCLLPLPTKLLCPTSSTLLRLKLQAFLIPLIFSHHI